MPQPRYLRNAPITEAIIDLRVKAAAGFHAEKFAELKPHLIERFPKMEEQRGVHAMFEMISGPSRPPTVQVGIRGYFLKSADDKTIVQFRVDGFTVNRLRPYNSWEELFPQAMELWDLYCTISKPEVITRLAVRYINRIELPSDPFTFEEYLRAAPIVPPELPQDVSSFLTRVTILDREKNLAAHVAQALEASGQRQQPAIIFDIDAYKESEFAIDDPTVKMIFSQLRALKNLIFFNYLTEETLRRFE